MKLWVKDEEVIGKNEKSRMRPWGILEFHVKPMAKGFSVHKNP
jgi:hypothetical protein